jgi:hypothetical protein
MANRLKTKELIAHFGGRIELWRRLEARGFKLSIKTIEKWMERDNIPSNRIVQLMALANYEGRPLDLNLFVSRLSNKAEETISHRHENKTKENS